MQPATIATVQFEPVLGDSEANFDRMDEHLVGLSDEVAMAVFPELNVSGYDLDLVESEAEPIPGQSTERLVELAADHDVHLVAGMPERAGSDVFNDLVYVSPSGYEASYRKRRLWGDETETFATGADPVVAETPIGTVGLLVCYDLNFPELAIEYGTMGADILVVSAAWRPDFLQDWQLLLRARALDTTSYVVASNHVGEQAGRNHAGHSMIVKPDGTIGAELETDPGSATASISPDELQEARERNPVLEYRQE